MWVESRAEEPILPLELFRNRTVAGSIIATFLITFGFFGAIIFIPRWFQFVLGSSATMSGYQMLPLLAGLIISSIAAGALVSRTGRYKAIILSGLAVMAGGLLLMSNLRTTTDLPVLWLWMFVTGLGIGPTLSVFMRSSADARKRTRVGKRTGPRDRNGYRDRSTSFGVP